MPQPVLTLTTDFGLSDPFVGTMKGVMLGVNPAVRIIDLTHNVVPGDIRAGALALAFSCNYFPRDTVHVAIIDPGVGSGRKALIVRTTDHYFVGPDNGVLSWAVRGQKILSVHSIENEEYFRRPVSRTFHGRDIFAPAAAYLTLGTPPHRFGPKQRCILELPWPEPVRRKDSIRGEVIYIDRFGNAITNIEASLVGSLRSAIVVRNGRPLCRLAEFYQAVPPASPVAVLGSSGFLEIAINGGDACRTLRLKPGSKLEVRSKVTKR